MKTRLNRNSTSLTILFLLSGLLSYGQQVTSIAAGSPDAERIAALISSMTMQEKIGQLSLFTSDWDVTGPTLRSDYKQLIREGRVGAIFNAYTVDYVKELQRIAMEESRLKIPLMFGYDVIHGHRTIFPIPLAQSCTWNMEAIEGAERIAATEASAEGINWTFAPMVDITRDPRWGRVSEGSGEDTYLGCRIAEARVRGFQGSDLRSARTIMACAKHFAAYGAPQAGRDYHTVDMSQVTLFETYLPPYKACVDAGAGSVMTSFNEIDGVPSTSNHWLLTDLLRKQWGFRGFVVTDYTSINELVPHGVAENISEAAMLAMNAGVDMDMQGSTFLNSLEALSAGNRINTGRIEEAVRLVLEAKARLGLFEDPYRYCDKKRESSEIMTTGNLSFARKMAAESCVLLKNEGNTLPIPPPVKKLAIIGPLADAKREMLGNWSAAGEWEKCVTLLEGMRNKLGSNTEVSYLPGCNTNDDDRSGFAAAVELAGKADYVILALGENGWMSGEASSRSSIDLPGVQLDLAAAIAKTGKPIVAVLFNGRPLALEKLHQLIPAILEAWFGGTEAGNGIADVLTGEVNPSGKLTMTFPRNTGQIPLFYNMKNTGRPYSSDKPSEKYVSRYLDCPNDPLYPFGFGLSYTSFDYSALKVNVDGEQIIVSVTVTNSGKRAGEEIVQLYVRDMKGTLTRPVRELKGFRKIHIGSGGTETITFILTRNDLAFYHTDLTRYYEPGSFTVFVGKNSAETLSTTFTLP